MAPQSTHEEPILQSSALKWPTFFSWPEHASKSKCLVNLDSSVNFDNCNPQWDSNWKREPLFCIHHRVFYSYVVYIFYNYHVKLSAKWRLKMIAIAALNVKTNRLTYSLFKFNAQCSFLKRQIILSILDYLNTKHRQKKKKKKRYRTYQGWLLFNVVTKECNIRCLGDLKDWVIPFPNRTWTQHYMDRRDVEPRTSFTSIL